MKGRSRTDATTPVRHAGPSPRAESAPPRTVLRISHSAVVTAWRERERALRRRGLAVRLLSAARWNEGGRLVTYTADGDDFGRPVRTFGSHPNVFVYAPLALWRVLGERAWDVIDIHEEPCSLAVAEVLLLRALRRIRAPFVLYSAQNIDKRYPAPFRWIERWALRHASGVSVCNSEAGRILQRKGLRAPAARIPLGVDIAHFSPRERAAPQGRLVVGYVGRLDTHKGVNVLLDALARTAEHRLVVVGDGPQRAELERAAEANGLAGRVEFRGHADASRLPESFREFDVLAVPSLPTPGWLEQFGRVVVEAMASGVPVIASRSGALPDVVGEAGMLAEPGDAASWADALQTLAAAPERWQELRAAGLRRAEDFTWERVADGMVELYAAATGGADAPVVARPDAEILVVAYGAVELLERALSPLAAQFALTVVDNSSSPAIAALAEQLGARYLDPGANLGFAAGVNYGLARRQRPGRDLLLLNPDAIATPELVRQLQAELAADERLACVAPAQRDPAGKSARVSWPFPTPARAWLEAVGLARLNRREGFVIGSILLLRARALETVGGFDERFFLYSEETDWQRRAVSQGWRVRECTDVVGLHVGAGTGGDPRRREIYFHASHERYVRKHHGAAGWWCYRGAAVAGAAARALRHDATARAAARLRLSLYLRGPVRVQADLDGGGVGS